VTWIAPAVIGTVRISCDCNRKPGDFKRKPMRSLERVAREGINLRASDDVDLPRTLQREAMRWWPWLNYQFMPEHPADRESITGGERPAEASAECPELAEGPAAEHHWNIDPTPYGDVGSKAGSNHADGEARAARDTDRLPVCGRVDLTTSDRDDAIDVESEGRAGGRAFEHCGVRQIPDQFVRDASREPIRGTAGWNAEAFEAGPSAILDRGPAPASDYLDHGMGTKRSRSPGLKRVDGSADGSKSRRAVRPIKFHPPGLSTA